MKKTMLILAVAISGILIGCGKSGDDNQKKPQPPTVVQPPVTIPPPTPLPSYQGPACPEPVWQEVSMYQSVSDADCSDNPVTLEFVRGASAGEIDITLDIAAQDKIFSFTAFLAYDPAVLEFADFIEGSFLTGGSATTVTKQVMRADEGSAGGVFTGCQARGKNALMLGQARQGLSVIGVSGSGRLGTIKFRLIPEAKSPTADFIFGKTTVYVKTAPGKPLRKEACWPKNIRLWL